MNSSENKREIFVVNSQKLRYLFVGGVNTIFGYFCGVALYKMLVPGFNTATAALIANILAITFSFLTYKIFVFKTKGNWFSEYLKAFVVYGSVALVAIFLLWIFIEKLNISIWLAQGLVTVLTIIVSYIGHARFTFKHRGSKSQEG